MTEELIGKVTGLVIEGYNSFMAFRESHDMNDFNLAAKKLELADAAIYASTRPRYYPTGEGWDLMLVNSPSKDELRPPTKDSILGWLKARSLA